jgi:quinohemoprotein ethanol dehydrogenase
MSLPKNTYLAIAASVLASTCDASARAADAPVAAGDVDHQKLLHADDHPGDWMSYGRTYDEQRFSPLNAITADNVKQLGLAWYYDLETNRGQEATPIEVGGVLYVSTAWDIVKAFQAASGKLLWSFDPKVPQRIGPNLCCDAVNRGVAVWKGKVYIGTLDGRLIAIDAASGKELFEVQTTDRTKPYSITQAPRIVKDKVILGVSGSDYNVRGYVSAYDTETGKMIWRFYTVPGDPSKPFENAAMAKAAKTWNGEWWKVGGGGAVWDAIAYDPELDLLYFGTDNGDPWNKSFRSPKHSDNLFITSIIAVKPDTGEYVWHYQLNPGDEWDFSATQQIILADLRIEGKVHKVLMQAPKNGFFYVLDRQTGELLSAKPFAVVTWAKGIDLKSGRPIENPDARYAETGKPFVSTPSSLGAHSWQPMSYNPKTGLVYIPAQDSPFPYIPAAKFGPKARGMNTGLDWGALEPPLKSDAARTAGPDPAAFTGYLVAWDAARQKEAWRIKFKGPWNGGTLSTAGNLLFQGDAAEEFVAYRADTGERLWSTRTQTGVIAAPITFQRNGEQYIAVMAGWGGTFALVPGAMSFKSGNERNTSRLLVFKLGGRVELPAAPLAASVFDPPSQSADTATLAHGRQVYGEYCSQCHGIGAVSGGVTPDLRRSAYLKNDTFFDIVLGGLLQDAGMASFAVSIDRKDAEAIRAYLVSQAWDAKNAVIAPHAADP